MITKKFSRSMMITALVLSLAFTPVISAGAFTADRYNMSYIYFGDCSRYSQTVESTRNALHEISPNYFNLDDDGNLELTYALDSFFINRMHTQGVKVIPFLSNHWDRDKGIKALENRRKLAEQITQAVLEYDLDGVNVDIENVTEAQRDLYTDFIRLLREALPTGKTLAVAVAANPYGIKTGWQASYDYTKLAEYSDYLMLMAYDESYEGGTAGPVASYSFVENTIKEALTKAPKEKIVLGIPFYGRYWKDGTIQGGHGVSNTDVEKLVRSYNSKVTFDQTSKSPKAVIHIGTHDSKPSVFYKQLEAGTYTIWYENEASIKHKLELVNKYDLKGTGSWSLGQETQETWEYYGMWLAGCYFGDAQGNWAQRSILSMVEKGWMKGVSENAFAPDKSLTRAEAAVILIRALGLTEKSGQAVGFQDVAGHWAKKEILIAAQNGIVQGIGNGLFSPDSFLTRQEMAVMLDRILEEPQNVQNVTNPYKDISKWFNPWSYDSMIKLTHSVFSQ